MSYVFVFPVRSEGPRRRRGEKKDKVKGLKEYDEIQGMNLINCRQISHRKREKCVNRSTGTHSRERGGEEEREEKIEGGGF